MVQLFDTLNLDAAQARICADGSLVAVVRAARTGIQEYRGAEVDPTGALGFRDKAIVRVYRPDEEVFAKDSLATYAAAPVTIDHPSVAVTADNWGQYGKGEINGDIARDGEFVRVPIIVRDAAAVAKVRTTHKQLSMGYACTLDATPGTAPDGQAFDAVQRNIRINHIAAVPAARGGPELKISDDASPLTHKEPEMAGTIIVDGLPVSLADEAAVRAVVSKKDAAIADAAKALTDAQASLSTEQGKVAALEKQLADAKAELAPAAIEKRVADRAKLVADAKKLVPAIVTDAVDEMAIRRAVVSGKLGSAADGLDDNAIAGAFIALLSGCEDAAPVPKVHNLAPAQFADTATVRDAIRAARYA
jgi:hypothetical protein